MPSRRGRSAKVKVKPLQQRLINVKVGTARPESPRSTIGSPKNQTEEVDQTNESMVTFQWGSVVSVSCDSSSAANTTENETEDSETNQSMVSASLESENNSCTSEQTMFTSTPISQGGSTRKRRKLDFFSGKENCSTSTSAPYSRIELSRISNQTVTRLVSVVDESNATQHSSLTQSKVSVNQLINSNYTKRNGRNVYPRGKKPDILCSVCQKPFRCEPEREAHEASVHRKEKIFQCDLCPHKFSYVSSLKDHVRRVHLKEKRFSCLTCSHQFYTLNDLKVHAGVHFEDLQIKCPCCPRRFNRKYNLKVHIEQAHLKPVVVLDLVCKVCGKEFTYPRNFETHMLQHQSSSNSSGESSGEEDNDGVSNETTSMEAEEETEGDVSDETTLIEMDEETEGNSSS